MIAEEMKHPLTTSVSRVLLSGVLSALSVLLFAPLAAQTDTTATEAPSTTAPATDEMEGESRVVVVAFPLALVKGTTYFPTLSDTSRMRNNRLMLRQGLAQFALRSTLEQKHHFSRRSSYNPQMSYDEGYQNKSLRYLLEKGRNTYTGPGPNDNRDLTENEWRELGLLFADSNMVVIAVSFLIDDTDDDGEVELGALALHFPITDKPHSVTYASYTLDFNMFVAHFNEEYYHKPEFKQLPKSALDWLDKFYGLAIWFDEEKTTKAINRHRLVPMLRQAKYRQLLYECGVECPDLPSIKDLKAE